VRAGRTAALVAALTATLLPSASAQADQGPDLAEVRQATAPYHRVSVALDDGFVPFSLDPEHPEEPTCFDSVHGGMGVHFVRNIDAVLDPADPEALVYEVTANGRLRLVGVEYIIPTEFVDPAEPPELLGNELHEHSYLPVYVLHAWVWRNNPTGMFADFNPQVGLCPD